MLSLISPEQAVSVSQWIWLILGFVQMVLLFFIRLTGMDDDRWRPILFFTLPMTVAMGLSVLGFAAVGQPQIALTVWRILAVVLVAHRLITAGIKIKEGKRLSAGIWGGGSILLAVLLVLAFASNTESLTHTVSIGVVQPNLPTLVPSQPAEVHISAAAIWRFLATGLLAMGTVVFFVLFVGLIQRGVPLQVESHWGGIGGGLGGWRLSSALTYLLVAILFGGIFVMLAFKDEASAAKDQPSPPQVQKSAGNPQKPPDDAPSVATPAQGGRTPEPSIKVKTQ